jgi:uncharacterized protein (DUF1778 family)
MASRGRPKKRPEETLSERFDLRLSAAEREEFERAADEANLGVSAWMRDRLLKIARREIPRDHRDYH